MLTYLHGIFVVQVFARVTENVDRRWLHKLTYIYVHGNSNWNNILHYKIIIYYAIIFISIVTRFIIKFCINKLYHLQLFSFSQYIDA